MRQKNRILGIFIVFCILSVFTICGESLEEYMNNNDVEKLQKELVSSKTKQESKLNESSGEVTVLVGQACVIYEKEKVWRQLLKGDRIKEKATVLTFENSEIAIKLATGSIVNLKQKTKAYFENIRFGKVKESDVSETGIRLMWGSVYSNVVKLVNTSSKYEVKAGSCVAGVRGTKFELWSDKEGNGKLTVYEGIVNLASVSQNINFDVNNNEKAGFDKSGGIKEKEIHNELPPEVGKSVDVKKDKYDLEKIYETKIITPSDEGIKGDKEQLNGGEKTGSISVEVR